MDTRISRIEAILKKSLPVEHLQLLDESHQHSGNNQETHLRLILVSEKFRGLLPVQRQKLIYQLVDSELKSGLHALTMRTLTPEEWEKQGRVDSHQSPPCHGGSQTPKRQKA